MPKRLNPKLAKIHRSYSVGEAAEVWGIHKHTVRNWIKSGLPTIDDSKPILIHGAELQAFLKNRSAIRKRPCAIDQIFCLKCRAARVPALLMADYTPSSKERGCLSAICPHCENVINRFVTRTQLAHIKLKLDVKIKPPENT